VKAFIRNRGRNYISPTVTAVGTIETAFSVMIAGFFEILLWTHIEGARITSSAIQVFNRRQPRISLARI
jgi:hypothetical protein